jgi:hypothetical protein
MKENWISKIYRWLEFIVGFWSLSAFGPIIHLKSK